MTDGKALQERDELGHGWYGWGSPVGLGIGLLCVGGFVALLALAGSLFT